jgi:hypothetical protein
MLQLRKRLSGILSQTFKPGLSAGLFSWVAQIPLSVPAFLAAAAPGWGPAKAEAIGL